MPSYRDLTHRDEIHGDVEYDPLAVALLNTSAMQRLGRVYQLGYGHLVYRGGTHTRLSHSMGAYATAVRIVTALERSYQRRRKLPKGAIDAQDFLPLAPTMRQEEELTLEVLPRPSASELADRWAVLRSLVGWAGLVHDLGHVPLGHTLEDEFEDLYEKHDSFTSPRLRHLWLAGADGVRSEIAQVLCRRDLYPEAFANLGITDGNDVWAAVFLICTWKENIAEGKRTPFEDLLRGEMESSAGSLAKWLLDALERLSGSLFVPYMADIVANTISADYLDYLRRDPHNLGLDVLRDDRVVSRFVIGKDHLGQQRMALSLVDRRGKNRLDTCTGVVELVRQRFRFAEIVYYHKTKVSASAMLARVLNYVGAPEELPGNRELLEPARIDKDVDEILSLGKADQRRRLAILKAATLPSALLDPEIGDETLHLLLRYQAWEKLEQAVRHGAAKDASQALRAISLLDAIARRRLHKVAFTMDADAHGALSGKGESSGHECERALQELIVRLRGNADERQRLEAVLVDHAGSWPDASLLLYVPPRKSQAKGIDTGALTKDGSVIPLGDHQAVEKQVAELNARYRDLWRLIVLVDPERASDAIGLSRAADGLVAELFPGAVLDDHAVIAALNGCCWFPYVARDRRNAAAHYRALSAGVEGIEIDWEDLERFAGLVDGSTTEEELALGGALLRRVSLRVGATVEAEKMLRRRFLVPGSLSGLVADRRPLASASESYIGGGDVATDTGVTITVLGELCDEICGSG